MFVGSIKSSVGIGSQDLQLTDAINLLLQSYSKIDCTQLMTRASNNLHYQNNSAKDVHNFGVFLFAFVLCLRMMEYVL